MRLAEATSPAFYSGLLWALTKSIRQSVPSAKVYSRGSVALGWARFPKSDLDTTIIVSTREDAAKVAAKFLRVKKWLPWCAETNIYVENEWRVLAPNMNCFEARRCPGLPTAPCPQPEDAERFVFLYRLMVANRDFFNSATWNPRMREKWSNYLSLCGISQKPINTDELIQVCAEQFAPLSAEIDWSKVFASALVDSNVEPWVEPVRWLTHHLGLDLPAMRVQLEDWKLDFFSSGIRFELCGLYSQIEQLGAGNLIPHVENLKAAVPLESAEYEALSQLRQFLS